MQKVAGLSFTQTITRKTVLPAAGGYHSGGGYKQRKDRIGSHLSHTVVLDKMGCNSYHPCGHNMVYRFAHVPEH